MARIAIVSENWRNNSAEGDITGVTRAAEGRIQSLFIIVITGYEKQGKYRKNDKRY